MVRWKWSMFRKSYPNWSDDRECSRGKCLMRMARKWIGQKSLLVGKSPKLCFRLRRRKMESSDNYPDVFECIHTCKTQGDSSSPSSSKKSLSEHKLLNFPFRKKTD